MTRKKPLVQMTRRELEEEFNKLFKIAKRYGFLYDRVMATMFHTIDQHPLSNKGTIYLEDVLDENGHFKRLPRPYKLGFNVAGTDLMVTSLYGDALKIVQEDDEEVGEPKAP